MQLLNYDLFRRINRLTEKLDANIIRLLGYFTEHKKMIGVAIAFMIGASLSSSLIAILLGKMTDIGFYDKQTWAIFVAPLGLILISAAHAGCMFMSGYLLSSVSQQVMKALRRELYQKLLLWPAWQYQQNSTGTIASKFVFEANVALGQSTKSFITLIRDSFQIIGLLGLLLYLNWWLTLVLLIVAPLMVLAFRFIAKGLRTEIAKSQAGFGLMLHIINEVFDAHKVIKITNAYRVEENRFLDVNNKFKTMMLNMAKISSLSTPLTQMISMIGVAVVLTGGVWAAQNNQLTPGEFVSFVTAVLLLIPPLRQLSALNGAFVGIEVAARSIFETIDLPVEEDRGIRKLDHCQGQVQFEDVSLHYPSAAHPAVDHFDLTIAPGENIAIVGLSGSGKTSLINMIPRFWNPTSGRILIDGIDTQELTLASLRSHISIVSQDIVLFDGTIRSNILYGLSDVSESRLRQAVEMASLAQFVDALPQGLDTRIGEAGSQLSGGQKQRIAIARAFVKNAAIVIFDEATSALDTQNEHSIQRSMQELMHGRTTIVIAHRLSTIRHADRIVAMSAGKIVEVGTHEALLARDGEYARLLKIQDKAHQK